MEAEVQRAVRLALVADAAVGALIADRIYDFVPDGAAFPYATVGDDQVIDDSDANSAQFEIFSNVHIWSRVPGRVECKRIASAVRDALSVSLSVTGWRCKVWQFRDTRFLNDPDGVTTHGIVEIRYVFERIA